MKPRFASGARRELLDAMQYYRKAATAEIAAGFVSEVERVASLVTENQGLGTLDDSGLRVMSLRRFPYWLVYRPTPAGALVLAIAHQRRHFGYWRDRQKESG